MWFQYFIRLLSCFILNSSLFAIKANIELLALITYCTCTLTFFVHRITWVPLQPTCYKLISLFLEPNCITSHFSHIKFNLSSYHPLAECQYSTTESTYLPHSMTSLHFIAINKLGCFVLSQPFYL